MEILLLLKSCTQDAFVLTPQQHEHAVVCEIARGSSHCTDDYATSQSEQDTAGRSCTCELFHRDTTSNYMSEGFAC